MKHTQEELTAIIANTKENRLKRIATIEVTTSFGNTFDGHDEARSNMNEAITAAGILEQTESYWKLADNTIALIALVEIKEALALAIQAKGVIILG